MATPSKYITLISSDGFEFVVLREAAMVSPVIKRMVDPRSPFQEAQTGRCHFQDFWYAPRHVALPPLTTPSPKAHSG